MNFLAALAMDIESFPKQCYSLFNRARKSWKGKCLKAPGIVVPGVVTNPKSTTRTKSPNEMRLR